jgi:RNA polymerase sigma-70 factor (ECF subfamily)
MLLADSVAAEDVIQQVFAALLRQDSRIEQEEHYLRRAVRNECYSWLRARKGSPLESSALLDAIPGQPGDLDERLALEDAIRTLPPEQREVIHLHVFEGWTFQQIADASETSINTVAARYRYALVRLRQQLRP